MESLMGNQESSSVMILGRFTVVFTFVRPKGIEEASGLNQHLKMVFEIKKSDLYSASSHFEMVFVF